MSYAYSSDLSRYNYQVEEGKNQALMESMKSDPERAEKDTESEAAVGLTLPYLGEKVGGYLKSKAEEGLEALKDKVSKAWDEFGSKATESVNKVFSGKKSDADQAIEDLGDNDKSSLLRTRFKDIRTEYNAAKADLAEAEKPVTGLDDVLTRAGRVSEVQARLKSINTKANYLADDVIDTQKIVYNAARPSAQLTEDIGSRAENVPTPASAFNYERDVVQPRIRAIQQDSFQRVGSSDSAALRSIDYKSRVDFSNANNAAEELDVMSDRLGSHYQALSDAANNEAAFEDPFTYADAPIVKTTRKLAKFGQQENYAADDVAGGKPVLPMPESAVTVEPAVTVAPRANLATEEFLGQGNISERIGVAASEIKSAASQGITDVARSAEVGQLAAKNIAGTQAINAENIASGAETAVVSPADIAAGASEDVATLGADDLAVAGVASTFGPIGTAIAGVAILSAALWHLFSPDESKPAVIPTPNYSLPIFQPGGH